MAGHLHDAGVDAALDHTREQRVQVGRLRRRALAVAAARRRCGSRPCRSARSAGRARAAPRREVAVVVLPFVPVTPRGSAAGRGAVDRSRDLAEHARGSVATSTGRSRPAAAIRSAPARSVSTATAPRRRRRRRSRRRACAPGSAAYRSPGEHGPRVERHPGDDDERARVGAAIRRGPRASGIGVQRRVAGRGTDTSSQFTGRPLCPRAMTFGSASAFVAQTRGDFGDFGLGGSSSCLQRVGHHLVEHRRRRRAAEVPPLGFCRKTATTNVGLSAGA